MLGHLSDVGRGGLLNLAGVVSNTLFNFLLVVVVTHGLGTTGTGLFFESIAMFNILAVTAGWGAEVGVVRMIPRYQVMSRSGDIRHAIQAAVIPAAVIGAVFAGLLIALAGPLGNVLSNGVHGAELAHAFRILAPFLPISAVYAVTLAATRGFGTMMPTTIVDKLGRAAAQPFLVLAVVVLGLSGTALLLAWVTPFAAGLIAASIWLGYFLRKVDGKKVVGVARSSGRRIVFSEFWRFTAPRGLASMFAVSVLWLDTLLIGALRSTQEAGIYAAATRYLAFGQFIGLAISQVAGPKLSQLLASGDRTAARRVYSTATSWLVALAWPLYLTMITLAPALLSVFGARYQQADDVLVILGFGMLFAAAVGPVDMVLLMSGKSSWNLVNTIIALSANVILNLLLIPRYGMRGAAFAWTISILINNLLPLVQVWSSMGLHPFGPGVFAAAGASALCFGIVTSIVGIVMGRSGMATLLVAAAVATPIYVALLWRFRDVLDVAALRDALRGRSIDVGGGARRVPR